MEQFFNFIFSFLGRNKFIIFFVSTALFLTAGFLYLCYSEAVLLWLFALMGLFFAVFLLEIFFGGGIIDNNFGEKLIEEDNKSDLIYPDRMIKKSRILSYTAVIVMGLIFKKYGTIITHGEILGILAGWVLFYYGIPKMIFAIFYEFYAAYGPRRPWIILNKTGINISLFGVGLVKWNEISSIEISDTLRFKIYLKNEKEYFKRTPLLPLIVINLFRLFNLSKAQITIPFYYLPVSELKKKLLQHRTTPFPFKVAKIDQDYQAYTGRERTHSEEKCPICGFKNSPEAFLCVHCKYQFYKKQLEQAAKEYLNKGYQVIEHTPSSIKLQKPAGLQYALLPEKRLITVRMGQVINSVLKE